MSIGWEDVVLRIGNVSGRGISGIVWVIDRHPSEARGGSDGLLAF